LLSIIAGVDLCDIAGISETICLTIISETGTNMYKWHNGKCFAAWLNVAPNTKITGGKIISSRMEKKKNYAGQAFRLAANALKHSKCPLGDHARKLKARLGKREGNVATAHKLAKIVYAMLKTKVPYNTDIQLQSEQKWKEKRIRYLQKELERLKKAS
jgi:transposase